MLVTDNISHRKHNFTCPTHFVLALQGILTGKYPAMSPGPFPLNPGPKTPLGPSSHPPSCDGPQEDPQNPRDPQRTKTLARSAVLQYHETLKTLSAPKTPYHRHRSAKQLGTAQHSLKGAPL